MQKLNPAFERPHHAVRAEPRGAGQFRRRSFGSRCQRRYALLGKTQGQVVQRPRPNPSFKRTRSGRLRRPPRSA